MLKYTNNLVDKLLEDKLTRFILYLLAIILFVGIVGPILPFIYEVGKEVGQSLAYWFF